MKTTFLKTIAIFAFCLFNLNSHAQTKEETISWLKEKLTDNLEGVYFIQGPLYADREVLNFKINECELFIKFKEKTSMSGGQINYYDLTIQINNLNIDNQGLFYSYGVKETLTKSDSQENQSKIGVSETNKLNGGLVKINIEKEENIVERMNKALKNLATFCPKKKETF